MDFPRPAGRTSLPAAARAAGRATPSSPAPAGAEPPEAARILEHLSAAVARICPAWLAGQRQDILHTAWVRVMETQRAAGPVRALNASYLWKAAYSAMVDEIRRRRAVAQRSAVVPDLESLEAPLARGPEAQAGSSETGRCINDCLQRLLPARRRAVTLHLIGYTPVEAGELSGWGVKQTRNLIYRGLADLRACLEAKGVRP